MSTLPCARDTHPLPVCCSIQSADPSILRQRKTVESLVSPPGTHAVSLMSPSSTTSSSGFPTSLRRTFISEECIAEDDEDMDVEPTSSSSLRQCVDSHSDTESDARSNSSTDVRGETASRKTGGSPGGRHGMPMRPLHNVRSSPQLLNQIHEEEGESDVDDLAPCSVAPPVRTMHRKTVPASDSQRKLERHQRKHITTGQRGVSAGATYSSSDASDTDDADRGRSCKDGKLKFHRRDSSDHSSDTDGPAGPTSLGAAHRVFNSGGARRGKNRSVKKGKGEEERKSQKGGKSGGGGGHQKHLATISSLLGKRDSSSSENIHLDAGVKLSNLSITSELSRSKYIVDVDGDDKAPLKDVDTLNDENVFQMHVIHVRSKVFTDLVDRFSAGDQDDADDVVSSSIPLTPKEPTAKVRRRHRDKVKTDINCNGVIPSMAGSDVNADAPQNTRVISKCCNVI